MKHRIKFHEKGRFAWSHIVLENGEPIWISVTPKGILIKKSKFGYVGDIIYKISNTSAIENKIRLIDERITETDSAFDISGIFLRVLTHLALLSKSAQGLAVLLKNIFSSEGPTKKAPAKSAAERKIIINDFRAFVEDNYSFGQFRDATELPHSKHIILDALMIEIGNQTNYEQLAKLRGLALMLVDFQENVGTQPLNELGMEKAKLHGEIRANKDDLIGMIKRIAEHPDRKKYVALRKIADQEIRFINNRIAAMERIHVEA